MPPAPPDAPRLMTVAEATAAIDAEPVEVVIERRSNFLDGHRVACEIRADRDYPAFDKSLMDGFAVRAADTVACTGSDAGGGGAALRVVGESSAGSAFDGVLGRGEAVRIMTGAPLPPGADAVIPIERVTVTGERVRPFGEVSAGSAVARRGSDRTAGDGVIPVGRRLSHRDQPTVLTVGGEVDVFRKPRVAVLTTGNEVVPATKMPGPHQVRDAIGPTLMLLVAHTGSVPHARRSVVPDDPLAIRDAIEHAMDKPSGREVLLVSGGMSMGRHDYVPAVLRDLGYEFRVTKLRMKPGKPFVFAVLPGGQSDDGRPRYAFGLPGNPVSAFVCTLVLASRLLARLGGGPADEFCREKVGVLTDPLGPNGDRQFYQPCKIDDGANGRRVTPLAWRGSADVFTLAEADALIVRPENDGPRAAGETVTIVEIPR